MSTNNNQNEGAKRETAIAEQRPDILNDIVGDFGRWQLKISVLMALVKFPIAWFQMSIVFLAPPTIFWCQKLGAFENLTDIEWVDLISLNDTTSLQKGINQGYCSMKLHLVHGLNESENNEDLVSCVGFGYNRSLFTSTITSEWDLVCDRQNFIDWSQVSLMFGVLLGNVIFGILADKKGRKTILTLCLAVQSVLGIIASFSPFFWIFVTLRFLLALANGGTMVTSFVICMEVVGGKWRTVVPILYQIPFGFGYAMLAAMAYLIRDWRCLHLIISVLSLLYVSVYWFNPESPRWLLATGRNKRAVCILKSACRENGISPVDLGDLVTGDLRNRKESSRPRVRNLFATRDLRKRSYLLCGNWCLGGVTFYAFIQHIGHISNNLFITVVLGGLISLPGTILCVFFVSNYGRRMTIVNSFLLTAVCALSILAFPKGVYHLDWPRMLLAGSGIIGLSISIPAMYLFTGELFPTVFRNSGIGLAMMFSRLGSMLAPLVISLQNVAGYLPLAIIGGATIVQAAVVLLLPETQGKRLPDTVEDIMNGNGRSEEMEHLNNKEILA